MMQAMARTRPLHDVVTLLPFLFVFCMPALCIFASTPLFVQAAAIACNYSSQSCGNLQIPYPFHMSPECGLPHYNISCKRNASYGDGELAFLQVGTSSIPELQVLRFSTNRVVVNSTELKAMPPPQSCSQTANATIELPEKGPFILAQSNLFVVIGCDSDGSCTAQRNNEQSDTISCSTSCYNQFDMEYCNTYACCINALPPQSRRLDFQGRGLAYQDFPNVCGFSTVLDPSTYEIPPNQKGFFAAGHYGLSISWALQSDQNCSIAKQGPNYACHDKAECLFDGDIPGYTCNCTQGYRGDGYKAGIGCTDIDECKEQTDECENPPLGICVNTDGHYSCSCTSGVGSGLPGTCTIPITDKSLLIPILLGGLGGAALLGIIFIFSCISRRAYKKKKEREENFKRIGGDQLKSFMFSESQLTKATKGFSNDHVLGEGGFGKVYWGKLTIEQYGDLKVAIKKAKLIAVEGQVAQIQSFVREILLLSKTIHKNVVRLLGCCVETSVPLLVYEFVEKGDLWDYLKTPSRSIVFQGKVTASGSSLWAWRLHVAVETAEALSYLHTLSEPIFHLDMKAANILIDKHYNPKVADFGLSCFLTSDATHLSNQHPAGTFGYMDPEYYSSWRVTDKCDVYSFGVILLQLISAMPAIQGPGAVLAHHFRADIDMRDEIVKQIKQLPSFIDIRLGADVDVLGCIHSVAELAGRCVAIKSTDRPSMQEVLKELRQIQSKNAGKLHFKGIAAALLDHDPAGPQELYGANKNEGEGAAFFDYNRIPSDQSYSSSSTFRTKIGSASTATSNDSQSAIIELSSL